MEGTTGSESPEESAVAPAGGPTRRARTAARQPATRRRTRRVLVGAVVVVVIVVLVATAVGLRQRTRGRPAPTPADVVAASARATLEHPAADVEITGSIATAGQAVPVQGSGVLDFRTGTMWADVTVEAVAGTYQEQEVVTGGQVYATVTGGGPSIFDVTGGPDWVAIPATQLNGNELGAGNLDPLPQLRILEQLRTLGARGAAVVRSGGAVVDGVTVTRYRVRPTMAAEEAELAREIRAGVVAPGQAAAVAQAWRLWGVPRLVVSVDGAGTISQVSLDYPPRAPAPLELRVALARFGSPMAVTVPPSSDVVSYAQYVQDQHAAAGTTPE